MASKNVLALVSCVALCVLAVGCSDGGAGPEATARAPSPLVVARLDGTFAFDLDASDVANAVRARCAADTPGDAAKAARCFDGVRAEARAEKVRFAKNADGQLVYTSFGPGEDGTPEIYLEAPLATMRGAMEIETPCADTVVLIDPKKGRLVYR